MFEALHLFTSAWWIPAAIACAIGFWAHRSFRQFKAKIQPLKAAVEAATISLEKIESCRAFTQEYEAVSPQLEKDPFLGATWLEFESTLILPTDESLVRNTRRPSEFFNEGLYYKGGVNLRTFEAVPNQLVGVGLLATFIGLVMSLLIAKQGLGADIETAKAALGDLLNAAAFKFVTSIAALGSSVAYVSGKNRLLHETDELIERFCRELERLMVQVTSESLAEHARKELITQTAQLERFNSELAVSIAEALEGKLRDSLTLALQPVASEIGKLSERMGQINQDALEKMVDRFSAELGGAAREHTDEMAKLLQTAAESIAAVPSHIDAAGERFATQIRAGADELSTSMMAAAENMDAALANSTVSLADAVDASAARFRQIGAEMEAGLERQRAFVQGFAETEEALAARLSGVLEAAQQTATQLSELAVGLARAGEATNEFAGLARGVAEAAELLRETSGQVARLAEHTDQLNSQAAGTVERLASQISTVENEIASLNSALAGAFDKVAGGVGQFGEKTTSFVKQLDKDLADAIGRLSGAVQQLDEVLGEMPKKADFTMLSKAINAARSAPREAAE